MNKRPYIYNPVANKLFEEYYEKIFENEQVDSLLSKAVDSSLEAFKKLTFDLAPGRDRNPDVMRVKLSDIANTKSVKSLTAKLIDYSDDNDLVNSKYSEAKRLYLEALKNIAEVLNRTSEISKAKDDVILKQFKLSSNKLQNSIDNIAKQSEEEEKTKAKNENYLESEDFDDSLNESLFTGYADRIKSLKKLLTNLISSSEGKDQKSGYGKDWKRIFIIFDERRKELDKSDGGEKSRKKLADLEKDVEKNQEEFNKSLIQAANRALKQLEDDEELYTSYSDVTNIFSQALDLMTRANTQYNLALKEIKDESEVKEVEIAKAVFPLKRGDTDSDKKIKNSGLILAIQNALSNGIPSAGKLIRSKGGPNGKYGPATTSVVSTIQKISGNKNINGQIDQSMLQDILISDWVSEKDKKEINKALQTIGSKMNENFSYVLGISEFFGNQNTINEGKIIINNSEFEKELQSQYKSVVSASPLGAEDDRPKKSSSSGVQSLAKNLRQKYNIKVESDDFTKQDGSLKVSYSNDFIKAWNMALDKADPAEEYSYFFYDGGVYNINLGSTSLKNACNWNKWAEARQIRNLGNEDATEFVGNYLKGWTTFGMVRPSFRYEGIKSLLKKNSENNNLDLSGPFEMMESSIKNKEIPFIDYENLKGDISKAFSIALQKGEKSPDLGKEEFVAINNFLVMISNCVSFDGSKFISCVKWINDNVLGESTAKRVTKDAIFGISKNNSDTGPLLSYEGSKIIVGDYDDLKNKRTKSKKEMSSSLGGISILAGMRNSEDFKGIKNILGNNCYYIAADIYPSISSHVKRMNATEFENLPQQSPFKCVNISK